MKQGILRYFLILLPLGWLMSCQEYDKDAKYRRPDWLAGKVYTQVKDQPELSTFARCIELSGYDTILDVSGAYTVFAPNNEAFSAYFQNHPLYNSPEDIPLPELTRLVKYHIVQNPWSKEQLRSLDVEGWIDTLALSNNEPRGYKRETLLLEKNWKFGVAPDIEGEIMITDTLTSTWHRIVATDSRKYAPIFYKEYFNIYNYSSADFEFYFDRSFANEDDMYYAGGRIIGDEIFAENGFVYNIDRVIDPLPNAYQLLSAENGNYSYREFLNLLFLFPEFTYNDEKTKDQPGAEEGYEVDSLFDLAFPELTFAIQNETTYPTTGITGTSVNYSISCHYGLLAPTDAAFSDFVRDYLEIGEGNPWGSLEDAPIHIKRIIAKSYLCGDPIYPTDFENGFYNGEMDVIRLNEADILEKQYASNCTFIGLQNAIVPRAFKSVTRPVYLRKGFSFSMYAIERSGLLSALKRENEDYMFFIESDKNCREDSSFLYDSYNETFSLYQLSEGSDPRQFSLGVNDLRILLLNHLGTRTPRGLARKEFIKNRAGNYLIVNNETGEIRGTAPSTKGYFGYRVEIDYLNPLSTNTDNGITYEIQNWFSFSAPNLYGLISLSYPRFHALLQKAKLTQDVYSRYNFTSDNEIYTVFAPTDSVLIAIQADTLSLADLKQFCLMHFIQGEMIFTDGSVAPGYFETMRKDESSTEFVTLYSKVYIEPGIDRISLPAKTGGEYIAVEESPNTNQISAITLESSSTVYQNTVNNAVVHPIKRAFIYELMDTK